MTRTTDQGSEHVGSVVVAEHEADVDAVPVGILTADSQSKALRRRSAFSAGFTFSMRGATASERLSRA